MNKNNDLDECKISLQSTKNELEIYKKNLYDNNEQLERSRRVLINEQTIFKESLISTDKVSPGCLIIGKKISNNQYRVIHRSEPTLTFQYTENSQYTLVVGKIIFIEGNTAHLEIDNVLTRIVNS